MSKFLLSTSLFWLFLLQNCDLLSATACVTSSAKASNSKDFEFSGSLENDCLWEVRHVKLAEDLFYDVEIINDFPVPMIFIHGWMDSRLSWMTIMPYIISHELMSNDQIIIIPSLRGHGDSQIFPMDKIDPKISFTYSEFVNDIHLLLTKLGFKMDLPQKFSIIGHSMGGGIAMKFAIEYFNNVNALVLMDTAPSIDLSHVFSFDESKNEPNSSQRLEMGKMFQNPQIEKGWITQSIGDIFTRENVKVSSIAARMSFNAFNKADLTEDLIEVLMNKNKNIKSLVMFGEEDLLSKEKQVEYAKKINGKVEIFKDCGHDPHYRHPQTVSDTIIKFLNGNENVIKNDL